jgi:hypothetical protein
MTAAAVQEFRLEPVAFVPGSTPALYPDGNRLLYVEDSTLFDWNMTSDPAALRSGNRAVISSDGSTFAIRDTEGVVVLRNGQELFPETGDSIARMILSNNGDRIITAEDTGEEMKVVASRVDGSGTPTLLHTALCDSLTTPGECTGIMTLDMSLGREGHYLAVSYRSVGSGGLVVVVDIDIAIRVGPPITVADDEAAFAVAIDSSHGTLLVGTAFGISAYLLESGELVWQHQVARPGDSRLNELHVIPGENLLVAAGSELALYSTHDGSVLTTATLGQQYYEFSFSRDGRTMAAERTGFVDIFDLGAFFDGDTSDPLRTLLALKPFDPLDDRNHDGAVDAADVIFRLMPGPVVP